MNSPAIRIAALLLLCIPAGCAAPPSGGNAVCDALKPALPTWGREDTEQSKQEGAVFLEVFNAVCDE